MRVLLLISFCIPLFAQEPIVFFPGVKHEESVPHPQQVLGFDFGERIAMHHEVVAYAKALAEASPRVTLTLRDGTWEGRKMAMLLISSEKNIQRLDALRQSWQALSDPRITSEAEVAGMTQTLPALLWLQESVHGNEISGTDSGMLLAWHLASAKSEEVDTMLEQLVVGIELMQNPDGRDHFIHYTRMNRSPLGADGHPLAAEHHPPWASGRLNHYNFDMNRDWFAMTQPETRTKVATFLEWYPHVVIDIHEMSGDSSFFAANPSAPANPLLSKDMQATYLALGKAIGSSFDRAGIDYFHGEIFDSFYPGYGESWPSLHGAVGILFEQGSARGLRWNRRDGHILTHQQAVWHQALASYAVASHISRNRAETLQAFYQRRKEAVEEDRGIRSVILELGDDPGRSLALGRLLQEQGIEVSQLKKDLANINVVGPGKRSRQDITAGSLLISLNQPAGRLARTLLLERILLDKNFLKEEQQRWSQSRAGSRIYDVTGWSLPMLYGVKAVYSAENIKARLTDSEYGALAGAANLTAMDAPRGFIIAGGLNVYPMMAAMLREGLRFSFTIRPIVFKGETFPSGSLILRRSDNPDNLSQRLEALGTQYQVRITGTNTSWFEDGPSFGSGDVRLVEAPRILLVWQEPTSAMSAGWMRYLVEQRFGYPLTAIAGERLGQVRLSDFDVILLPSGSGWDEVLGKSGMGKLKHWISEGGVLLSVGATTEWLIQEDMGLLDSVRELRGGVLSKAEDKDKHPKKVEKDPIEMVTPQEEHPRSAFGALLRVDLDPSHWMAAAMPAHAAVMVHSNRILRPLRLDKGANPARFTDRDNLLLSGHAPDETLEQFAHKPFLMVSSHGQGQIIAFTEEPYYRAFMRGLEPLLGNAIFFGPSMTR